MKRISSILARLLFDVLAVGLLFISPDVAAAQVITVTVPFPFSAGNQNFAMGAYRLSMLSNWLVSVRSLKTGEEWIFPVHLEQGRRFEERGCLIFQRFEDRIYLAQVHVPGADRYGRLNGLYSGKAVEIKACSPTATTSASSKVMAGR